MRGTDGRLCQAFTSLWTSASFLETLSFILRVCESHQALLRPLRNMSEACAPKFVAIVLARCACAQLLPLCTCRTDMCARNCQWQLRASAACAKYLISQVANKAWTVTCSCMQVRIQVEIALGSSALLLCLYQMSWIGSKELDSRKNAEMDRTY